MRSSAVGNSLKVLLFNARSIRNKFLEFQALVATEDPHLVGITESWIRTSVRDLEGEFAIPGYQMFHKDRKEKEGGGVLLYVKNTINTTICSITSDHEVLCVDLQVGTSGYRALLVYRPPSQLLEKDKELYQLLNQLVEGRVSIVMGDFNCHVDWKTKETCGENALLVEFVNDGFLTQWVREPTRGTNILDLVLTSEDDIIDKLEVGEEFGGSDHRLIRFTLRLPLLEVATSKNRDALDFRRANFAGLRDGVANMVLDAGENVEDSWMEFKNSFMSLQHRFIPLRCRGRRSLQPKWFNQEIGNKLREKRTAYRRAKITGDFEHHRRLTRKVKSNIRAAKRAEEIRVARLCKENPKEFFSYVNSRKPIRRKIGPLVNEYGTLQLSDVETANILNGYFSSVFTKENGLSPEPSDNHEGTKLEMMNFNAEDVSKKIDKLNKYKSPGPDGFLPRVLKEVRNEVSPFLAKIFNTSMRTRCVPSDWREAEVTPIFKKGDPSQPSNHRPISLTSIVGKLMEGIMVDTIIDHLETNGLLRNSQHGFRRHRSCLTNLLEFFHFVFSEQDRDKAVDVIYLDFQKAFDKVPHRRLLRKVRAHGIDGAVADWIENWLKDRRQRVVVNGQSSEWVPVTSGVPQGSVLGPLLFIIYVNDMDDGIISKISKFADDTKLGINVAKEGNIQNLQEDLRRIGEWSDRWQMPFNVDKCKVMHIGHRNPQTEYSLQGRLLESTVTEKDLGVVISSDLKFSKQCIEAEKKAQRMLGYIKRQFGYRNREIVLTLYNSLVRPHLEYAVQFWSPTLRKDIARLERVQARATKLIPSLRHKRYEDRLKELDLFSLETRRLRGQLIELFKILKGFDNVDYGNMFCLKEGITRNNGLKLELRRFHRDLCGNFFTYSICDKWNSLPMEVVNSESVESFKTRLDKVLHHRLGI